MVPHILDEGVERLDRFGEHKDKNEGDGVEEASSGEAPHEEEAEEQTMDEDEREEEGLQEEDEDGDEDSESHGSSGSMQESPCSTHGYSDRCHHCLHSWAERSKSGNGEDGSFGKLSVSENSEGERGGEVGHPQAPPSSPLCEQESLGEPPEVVGQTVPSETASTMGDLPPAGGQEAVVIHATEDELRSIK